MYFWVFPSRDAAVGAASGSAAATAAVLVSHPIESVKVRMQSGHRGGDALESSWRRGLGLLRRPYYGIGPHWVQYTCLNALRFGSYAAAKGFFEGPGGGRRELTLQEIFLCGAFSGTCIAGLLHPLWVVKTHQQVNRISGTEACRRLFQGEGLRGFFRGYVSGFARFPLALGVFFATYEGLKRPALWREAPAFQPPPTAEAGQTALATWLVRGGYGAFAGILCWTSIFPLDVVQSRMLGEAAYGADRRYAGALTSIRRIYAAEGAGAFVRGYSAVLLRSGPVNAVMLPVNDAIGPLVEGLLPEA